MEGHMLFTIYFDFAYHVDPLNAIQPQKGSLAGHDPLSN